MPYRNVEDKKKWNREWNKKNREYFRKYDKKWREENREEYLAERRKFYYKHNEVLKEKAKIRSKKRYYNVIKQKRLENKEKYKELDRIASEKRYAKRKSLLLQLRQEMGGLCAKCGYGKEIRILQFHHHNGNKIDNVTNLQSLKKIREEATKCILLCPNCHALEHLNYD